MRVDKAQKYNARRFGSLWDACDLTEDLREALPADSVAFSHVVRDFQARIGVKADGMLGPVTLRRVLAEVESHEPEPDEPAIDEPSDYIIFDGKPLYVPGVHIVTMDEPGGSGFYDGSGKGHASWSGDISDLIGSARYAYMLATVHWDATLSAATAFRVLKRRHYSTCFGIDNPRKTDGVVTVYQWLDPGIHRGYHAGSKANRASLLSFDMSNAVYLKYADTYKRRTGIDRPVIKPRRKRAGMLGMYSEQILALLRILKAVSGHTGLPLTFPTTNEGKPVTGVFPGLFSGEYHGAHTHLHITRNKWDVAGLEDQIIIMLLEDEALRDEFPTLVDSFRLSEGHWSDWLDGVRSTWTWGEIWQ